MKAMLLIPLLFVFVQALFAQDEKSGKVVIEQFLSPAIAGNKGGEDPIRRLTLYLPPGYDNSRQRYPVIYFLHGFTRTDSFSMAAFHLKEWLDTAIAEGLIRHVDKICSRCTQMQSMRGVQPLYYI